jgi:hypothetical protein
MLDAARQWPVVSGVIAGQLGDSVIAAGRRDADGRSRLQAESPCAIGVTCTDLVTCSGGVERPPLRACKTTSQRPIWSHPNTRWSPATSTGR